MRDRAFRRVQEDKKKSWVKKIFPKYLPREITDVNIGIYAHTPARCSCNMCGNPRKHWNDKTMQEKRMDDSYRGSGSEVGYHEV